MLEQFNQLVATLYRTTHEEDGWQSFLNNIVSFSNSHSGTLSVQNESSGEIEFLLQTGFDATSLTEWQDYYFERDLWTKATLALNQVEDRFINADTLVSREQYLNSEFFNDFGLRVGMHHAAGGYFTSPAMQNSIRIAFQQDKPQGTVNDETMKYLHLLTPHIKQVLSLSNHLQPKHETQSGNILDAFPHAVFICEFNGKLVSHNHHAEKLIRKKSPVMVKDGRLMMCEHRSNTELAVEISQAALRKHFQQKLITFTVDHIEYVLKLVPWLDSEDFSPLTRNRVIVMIKPAHEIRSVDAMSLRQIFGLTIRESEVVMSLSQGHNTKGIALTFHLEESTIRSHIKSAMRKTNSKSQHRLVALLHSLF